MLCFVERESGFICEKVKRVAPFFDDMEFPYEISTDMRHEMWANLCGMWVWIRRLPCTAAIMMVSNRADEQETQ
ncbi:hypothetical protein D3C78_1774010 [compost metagenome]